MAVITSGKHKTQNVTPKNDNPVHPCRVYALFSSIGLWYSKKKHEIDKSLIIMVISCQN